MEEARKNMKILPLVVIGILALSTLGAVAYPAINLNTDLQRDQEGVMDLSREEELNQNINIYQNGNDCPDKPIIWGPTDCKVGNTYRYYMKATDPNGDDLIYKVYTGDGNLYEGGPFPSGTVAHLDHTWTFEGTFEMRGIAWDGQCHGEYSDELTINVVPRSRAINTPFLRFLENHPNLFSILGLLLQRLGV